MQFGMLLAQRTDSAAIHSSSCCRHRSQSPIVRTHAGTGRARIVTSAIRVLGISRLQLLDALRERDSLSRFKRQSSLKNYQKARDRWRVRERVRGEGRRAVIRARTHEREAGFSRGAGRASG